MAKFYNNRELSDKFGVNLARWKRWSREFLPPDPLAGRQAGYARQYYVDNAFTVYLGGRLVSDLGFSIPEARWILEKSHHWMKAKGFHFDPRGNRKPLKGIDRFVESYAIHIQGAPDSKLTIFGRGVIGRQNHECEGHPVTQVTYVDQPIVPPESDEPDAGANGSEKVLLLSMLLVRFRKAVDPEGVYFPGLNTSTGVEDAGA